jgi:hypothetical protein
LANKADGWRVVNRIVPELNITNIVRLYLKTGH